MDNQIEKLYESDGLVVVNKPTGLIVHSDGKREEDTLVDWLLTEYPDIKGVGEDMVLADGSVIERPGIVHRLDRETSGVLVMAKTQEAYLHLKEQFAERVVKKEYRAYVYGTMRDERGTIDRPIGRSKQDIRKWSAQRGARGELREAQTTYRVLKEGEGYSYLALFPRTGRTHQIRVHLKAVNHPVVCDKLYAPKHECALGFDRLALHAHKLIFKDLSGKEIAVEATLPEDFLHAETLLASEG